MVERKEGREKEDEREREGEDERERGRGRENERGGKGRKDGVSNACVWLCVFERARVFQTETSYSKCLNY